MIFFGPRMLHDFFPLRGCVIVSEEVARFSPQIGCVIFFVPRDCNIFICPERLHDFFVPRVCLIFCPEGLHDFFVFH